jgi:uncharacterized protein YbjT (DUF2867 family)
MLPAEENMFVVTGASGNTGKIVAQQLLSKNQPARVIGRSAERLQPLVKQGAEAFVGDITDASALARAFSGARAVYAMIPPNYAATDTRAYQRQVIEAIATAIELARVKHVVALSSIGADKKDKTGPVAGLHLLEERFSRIPGLNVLFLRAGYFMENTLAQAGIIKTVGSTAGPVQADLKLPMIATRDIGAAAAESLLKLDFQGAETRELLGQRDLAYSEVAAIIGRAIGKTSLGYNQAPDEQLRPVLQQMGMSQNVAGEILELAAALNSGHIRALEPRTARNTTPTSYETFVEEEFLPVYEGQSAAA